MNLKLTEHNRSYLRARVESGDFEDETSAVNEAIALLEQRDSNLEELRRLIGDARSSVARGEAIPYSAEFLQQIEADAIEAARKGLPISAHVRP